VLAQLDHLFSDPALVRGLGQIFSLFGGGGGVAAGGGAGGVAAPAPAAPVAPEPMVSQGQQGGLAPDPSAITRRYSATPVPHPVLGGGRPHPGVDIRARAGDPVLARISGQVDFAGRASGYGGVVVLGGDYLADGTTRAFTLQGHLADLQVERGAYVLRGDVLGFAARRLTPDIGTATGPHEHLGVYLLPPGAAYQMPSPFHFDPMEFDWSQVR